MRPIELRGARQNNLCSVDLTLEPGTLVAVTGPSGAGKSSLAFGTLYAEGQRRYVESFSAYARQFLERLARPEVDALDPVPAAVAVDRSAPVRTSRSTVGTMTELCDYAKSLWAHSARLCCPGCGAEVQPDEPGAAAESVIEAHSGARVAVSFAVRASSADALALARDELRAQGYGRVLAGGALAKLDELDDDALAAAAAEDNAHHGGGALAVIADRSTATARNRRRLSESLAAAMHRGGGRARVHVFDAEGGLGVTLRFSDRLHCADCERDFRPATPGLFSFNSPIGACPSCRGFGRVIGIDVRKVLPDPSLSLSAGAIRPWRGKKYAWERRELARHAKRAGIPWSAPVSELSAEQLAWLVEGEPGGYEGGGWWGLRGWFSWLESKTYKLHVRVLLARYRAYDECPACAGARLRPEALWWRVRGLDMAGFLALSVADARQFLLDFDRDDDGDGHGDGAAAGSARARGARGDGRERDDAAALLRAECLRRLSTLADVGLAYLTLDRASRTLSGGETQRVALTGALGASLAGALIVMDEPSVGLHPHDVGRLAEVVQRLAAADNTVLVVEHDWALIQRADRVVELGPGAGREGGRVVFDGAPEELLSSDTATGRAHRGARAAALVRREPSAWIELRAATGHNLRGVDVAIPRGLLTCVTGVSGSGKSSLILGTLAPAVIAALGGEVEEPALPHAALAGADALADAVVVDQSPLGRTARGNPATYVKAWDWIRGALAKTEMAAARGLSAGAFSFNVPGGRCESCKGEGAETVEMQFLADVSFSCPDCGGKRFVGPVLEVRYQGKNVVDILEMSVDEALACFSSRTLTRRLQPVVDVGLGYLRLGQPLNTLSGGEAQRLKLAEALARTKAGGLVILDEPTAGLHAQDVVPLRRSLEALVARGDTVVVVEHDMALAAHADWIVDLGPGAGAHGGTIVASGTPEQVAAAQGSSTAPHLAAALAAHSSSTRTKSSPAGRASASVGASRAAQPGPVWQRAPIAGADIEILGAREHNLRDLSLRLPREQLVVVTGPSGSGKSTLAFDVLYAEGQRRYLETLSPYARQYMPQLPRPAVDRVLGVPPSVALEQRVHRGGAGSTVATITEVAHYLRVMYARAGLLHCPDCEVAIAPRAPELLARDLAALARPDGDGDGDGDAWLVMAPVVRGRKGLHRELLARAREDGIERARIDGAFTALRAGMKLDRYREHDVELVIAELPAEDAAMPAALGRAAALSGGSVRVRRGQQELLLSTQRACPSCGTGFPELDPRMFSFHTRQGACPACEGRGVIEPATRRKRGKRAAAEAPPKTCPDCAGTRLSPLARAVTVAGWSIAELFGRSVLEAGRALADMQLDGRDATIAAVPLAEARARLSFLASVGVGYLELDRPAATLSGGETQRVRLAAQLGSGLTGILYVLDEPTIGLHPRDTGVLLDAMRALVERGNSLVVVEHDPDTIRAADFLVDIGPGGGHHGGRLLACGAAAEVLAEDRAPTAAALRRPPPVPAQRRVPDDAAQLELRGARRHNLRDLDLRLPLGCLVAVTGVSGSGKSTLIREVLLEAVGDALARPARTPPRSQRAYRELRGAEALRRAVEIDQSPIGRTSRSVPATYVGVWNHIRALLANTPEARARGYGAARFSFNTAEGRCPTCEGQGRLKAEMAFLPDVEMDCEACAGMRFDPDTLDITWRGRNAGEILALEIGEAAEVFASVSKVARPLALLDELGLGYLKLGQPSSTLSGGEAQRLKLVSELGARSPGGTLYVMDEPTTGLHRDDVVRLLALLDRLVERGDTVVVIEHHTDVMLAADWIVDLGPEGGAEGGRVLVSGPPEDVAACAESHTGAVLAAELQRSAHGSDT
ncbi:excinuclease ABC subunit UvrA [Haliangium ochraceum]|uniref:UvrABC system protein A n=1 Tax=Haliangium ochraceum (strain DSM 14365 / JCM 11303 / SMP-2) TaxID=502025 RepID=D0LX97_HALO1|nr:excinuclease ABC subunit UvrA [Haliangium ochraceum]ACY16139.1 excinuclease ABC, A subunit [Haliangium ochraceum DSM 14365]